MLRSYKYLHFAVLFVEMDGEEVCFEDIHLRDLDNFLFDNFKLMKCS